MLFAHATAVVAALAEQQSIRAPIEKRRKDNTFQRQFNEKPSVTLGCLGSPHQPSSESANRTACLSCGLIWHGVQVNELLQEKTVLEGHSKQYLHEKDTLHTRVTGLQTDNEALADQLSSSNAERNWLSERLGINAAKSRSLSEENDSLKKQLQALQGSSNGPQGQ